MAITAPPLISPITANRLIGRPILRLHLGIGPQCFHNGVIYVRSPVPETAHDRVDVLRCESTLNINVRRWGFALTGNRDTERWPAPVAGKRNTTALRISIAQGVDYVFGERIEKVGHVCSDPRTPLHGECFFNSSSGFASSVTRSHCCRFAFDGNTVGYSDKYRQNYADFSRWQCPFNRSNWDWRGY